MRCFSDSLRFAPSCLSCLSCLKTLVFVFLCAVAVAGEKAEQAPAIDLKKGLVAHYPFDKDASDASGNGHDAINKGAVPAAEGKIGGAFAFDGVKAHVVIPAKATQGLTWFTIALWCKTTQSVAGSRYSFWANPSLLSVATAGWGSHDFGLMIEKGNAAYFHGLRDDTSDMSFFSTTPVADGQWHHVAIVDEGPRIFLYVDGQIVSGEGTWHRGEGQVSLGVVRQTASGAGLCGSEVFLGAADEPPNPRFFFRGLLDDVKIWSRALTAEEIAALAAYPGGPASRQ